MIAVDLFLLVLSLSTIVYIFFVGRLLFGLGRLAHAAVSRALPSVTVVIPARNEASSVGRCISSVLAQDYPRDLLRIIVVDDDSTDGTAQAVRSIATNEPRVKLRSLRHRGDVTVGQKPVAIMEGVRHASGEIVITTDADCSHGPAWVRTMVACFDEGVAMVAGPVQLTPASTLFGRIEELDFFALIVTSAGLIGAGRPIICNGANLAIRRDAYNAVRDDVQVSSNDDGTLMSRIVTRGIGEVRYAYRNEAIVRTEGKGSFAGFVAQRRRWASVRNRYLDPTIYLELAGLFLFFLTSLLSLVAVPFLPPLLPWAAGVWMVKGLLDWIALAKGAGGMDANLPLRYFVPALLFQPFGWVTATFLSVFSRFEWKGRRFNR